MTHIYTGIKHSQVTLSREHVKSLVWADRNVGFSFDCGANMQQIQHSV